jgi:hypothetical protein
VRVDITPRNAAVSLITQCVRRTTTQRDIVLAAQRLIAKPSPQHQRSSSAL